MRYVESMRAWPLLVLAIACVRPPPADAPKQPPAPRCTTGVVAGVTTKGTIRGLVRDTKSGEPVAGATAIVTADGAQTQAAISDQHGVFAIEVLPGLYALNVFYADLTAEQPCVSVEAAGTATVWVKIDQPAMSEI